MTTNNGEGNGTCSWVTLMYGGEEDQGMPPEYRTQCGWDVRADAMKDETRAQIHDARFCPMCGRATAITPKEKK